MLRLRLQLGNLGEIPRRLEALARRLEDWGPFFKYRFIPEYLDDVNKNFDTQGSLVGGWKALSPEYAAWKQKHYPGRRMLERTLRLRQSLKAGSSTNPDLSVTVTKRQAFITTKVPYAQHVNKRRRFMLSPRDLDKRKYGALRDEWVRQIVREGGLG